VLHHIIYYRDFLAIRDEHRSVILAPASLHERIVRSFHDAPDGHNDPLNTSLRIRLHYWWPNMTKSTREIIGHCYPCLQSKTSDSPRRIGTFSSVQATSPMQEMAADLYYIGDLDQSAFAGKSPFTHALVGVYSFSRHVCIAPLTSANSDEVAHNLALFWVASGVPAVLRHDLGSEFEGLARDLCRTLNVAEVVSAPRSHHSNGSVERVNREIKAEIKRLRLQSPGVSWHRFIPTILHKLRNTPHKALGYTSNELSGIITTTPAGRAPTPDTTQIFDFSSDFRDESLWNDWAKALEHLQHRRSRALNNDIKQRDTTLTRLNARSTPHSYKVDDWAHVIKPSAHKTGSHISPAQQITHSIAHGRQFILSDPVTGRTTTAGVTSLVPADPPDTNNIASAGPSTTRPEPLAAIVHTADDGYYVVDDSANADSATPLPDHRFFYTNTRSGRLQNAPQNAANWIMTKQFILPDKTLSTFQFSRNDAGRLIIPLNTRRAHRDIIDKLHI
jgi:hypothetical protein